MAEYVPNMSPALEQATLQKLKVEIEAMKDASKRDRNKAQMEVRKLEAEALRSEAEARIASVTAEEVEREREEILAHDAYNQVFIFDTDVNASSVSNCIRRLTVWHRTRPRCDMEIIFKSPGGSVVDGMALFDFIQQLRRQGHKVTTVALGVAASMAGILLQAGDVRIMNKEAWLLVHQIQSSVIGSWGEIEDRVKWLDLLQERILDIFAARMSEVTGKTPKSQRDFVARKWTRTDWWLDSDMALKLGLIDEIR